jgi:hypothetical protein
VGQRDDHAIEWIPVEERQGSRRARDAGIESDLPQIVPIDETKKPPDGRLQEPELASGYLDRDLPRADDGHIRLRRLPQGARGAVWQVTAR